MTWNYRVIKRHYDESGITVFAIHEVYYNEDQSIDLWSKDPMAPNGETITSLQEDLKHFQEAIGKPVLVEKITGEKTVLIEDKEGDRRWPKNWHDFFEQEPCHDFPTIEELRGSQGEDVPRESLDLSPEETEELFEKSNLLIQIEDYVFTLGTKKASEKLCINEVTARDLAKGLIDKFTVEELQDIANKVPSSFSSPFAGTGGVKTKATTQNILDAIKDSRSRKGKE